MLIFEPIVWRILHNGFKNQHRISVSDFSMTTSPPSPPSTSKRQPLWRILGTLLSIALLGVLIYNLGWEDFTAALKQVPLTTFAAACGLMLLSRMCVTLRWFVLLRSAGVRIPFLQTMRLTFMGLFASNFLPSTVGGDVVRMGGAVYQRVDPAISAASLVVDRLVGMAGMVLFLPFGLLAVLSKAGEQAISLIGYTPMFGLAGIPGFNKLRERALHFLRSLLSSAAYWLRHPASLGWALLCTFGHMLFTYLSVSVLLDGMGQPLPFWTVGGLWSISYFISLVPIAVNGFGFQELSINFLYTHFGGITPEAAMALAIFMRITFMIASLPGALFLPDILKPAAPSASAANNQPGISPKA